MTTPALRLQQAVKEHIERETRPGATLNLPPIARLALPTLLPLLLSAVEKLTDDDALTFAKNLRSAADYIEGGNHS